MSSSERLPGLGSEICSCSSRSNEPWIYVTSSAGLLEKQKGNVMRAPVLPHVARWSKSKMTAYFHILHNLVGDLWLDSGETMVR